MSFDIAELGDRSRPAFNAIMDTLEDGEWHTHAQLTIAAMRASDVAEKTIDNLIRSAWRARWFRRHKPWGEEATYRLRP